MSAVALCSVIQCSNNSPTVINIPPQDATVFINMTGMFSCEASGGDYILWRVNGTGFEDLSSEILSDIDINPEGISSGLSTLDITARAVYNGTTVQCVTGMIGGIAARSENVTLKIQGNDIHNKHVFTTCNGSFSFHGNACFPIV